MCIYNTHFKSSILNIYPEWKKPLASLVFQLLVIMHRYVSIQYVVVKYTYCLFVVSKIAKKLVKEIRYCFSRYDFPETAFMDTCECQNIFMERYIRADKHYL